ncbi:MAG: NADH-quinone oxidoreductase subunit N [Puniceicoccales bacterium]|jgi:NADH-quinone oxidoreductase subunit N|nr:NADH-quinone oxidoreductase subunit N [Puniceicoccales bacterium]
MNDYGLLIETLLPETALVVAALAVLAADLAFLGGKPHRQRLGVAGFIALVGLAVATVLALNFQQRVGVFPLTGSTHLTGSTRAAIFVLTFLTTLFIVSTSRLKNPAEHIALTLFAAAGCSLMVTADNLLVIFASLELASLSLYILAGFDKTSPASAEAGLKYFLYGGTAAAFLLFGFSLLYGLTGEIGLGAIAQQLSRTPETPLLVVAAVLVFVGFGYKVAAAPFHIWAPDAYQGAPVTSAALIASASKVAGFVLLARVLSVFWCGELFVKGQAVGWVAVLLLLAAVSLLLGNIVALAQQNIRRLLAYSAIAHAGVLLLGALAAGAVVFPNTSFEAQQHLAYYLFTYGLATVGVFGVVAVMEANGLPAQRLSDFAGLWQRSRLLGGTLMVFVLSLAGVPPLAGFMAKFLVLRDALALAAAKIPFANFVFALVLLAVALTVLGLFYYLQILRYAFVSAPKEGEPTADTAPLRVPTPAAFALVFAAAALVVTGILAAA